MNKFLVGRENKELQAEAESEREGKAELSASNQLEGLEGLQPGLGAPGLLKHSIRAMASSVTDVWRLPCPGVRGRHHLRHVNSHVPPK